jgi:3-deoxy-D-manno-octulosonic-acid transferase
LDLKQKFKDLITIIIPRHINRSEDIIENLKNLKLKVIKRTSGLKPSSDCDILVVDTYGEMSNFLELSNLAFIGGSIINHGGQNPLEAVRMGNYVMHGGKIDNFKEIYKELKNYKISSEVKNISEMKKVFVKKYNYKKSKNKIKRIHDLGSRIFRENIKEIQNYL